MNDMEDIQKLFIDLENPKEIHAAILNIEGIIGTYQSVIRELQKERIELVSKLYNKMSFTES